MAKTLDEKIEKLIKSVKKLSKRNRKNKNNKNTIHLDFDIQPRRKVKRHRSASQNNVLEKKKAVKPKIEIPLKNPFLTNSSLYSMSFPTNQSLLIANDAKKKVEEFQHTINVKNKDDLNAKLLSIEDKTNEAQQKIKNIEEYKKDFDVALQSKHRQQLQQHNYDPFWDNGDDDEAVDEKYNEERHMLEHRKDIADSNIKQAKSIEELENALKEKRIADEVLARAKFEKNEERLRKKMITQGLHKAQAEEEAQRIIQEREKELAHKAEMKKLAKDKIIAQKEEAQARKEEAQAKAILAQQALNIASITSQLNLNEPNQGYNMFSSPATSSSTHEVVSKATTSAQPITEKAKRAYKKKPQL